MYLIGMKHTGKSSIAPALAARYGRPHLDTDAIVQELDRATEGSLRTVRDIYRDDGSERFRQLERAACRLTAERTDSPVVATGGGICDNPEALDAIANGLLVHLVDTYETLVERVLWRGIPAFLDTHDERIARERFRMLYERRLAQYERIAHITVRLDGLSVSAAIEAVAAAVEEHNRGR